MKIYNIIFLITLVSSLTLFAVSPDDYTGHWLIRGFQAHERIQNHQKRGDDYGDICELIGFIRGVAITGDRLWWNIPDHNTGDQFEAVIIKYMNAHPEKWGEPASTIIGRAFMEAFPINKNK